CHLSLLQDSTKADMSNAEAFGHFRSFAVGLEKNARALRKVLEEECLEGDGPRGPLADKRGNGRLGSARSAGSIARSCSQVLETASADVTTKELVNE
ncbi:unnamed protein product, partial [Sphacelaria rigidula]